MTCSSGTLGNRWRPESLSCKLKQALRGETTRVSWLIDLPTLKWDYQKPMAPAELRFLGVTACPYFCRSAEGLFCAALLELQRQMARNEKLLAAKDNEIKALREQVELQRG